MSANLSFDRLTIRRPTGEDAQAVLDLMIACDIADYGEADSSLDDLQDEWTDLDLNQDAWLALDSSGLVVGYAAVSRSPQRFDFNFYVHPTRAPAGLTQYLLTRCEARAQALWEDETVFSTILSQVNQTTRQGAEELGYQPKKYYFGMRIRFGSPPPSPIWPAGLTLRNIIPGQDDRLVYDFIQAAFERPGRTPPTFERWHEFMLGAQNFDPKLWFLAYLNGELIGAALCFDYPQYGWVRQLGVTDSWRRRGIASALLRHVFGVFYSRGQAVIGLSVESDNPQAYHLYETVGMQRVQQYIEYRKTLLSKPGRAETING